MDRRRALVATLALAFSAVDGCRREDPILARCPTCAEGAHDAHGANESPVEVPASALPVEARTVPVPGALPAFAVTGPHRACPQLVFLSGMCSHGLGYIQAFQFAAHEHGGIMALQGDIDCGNGVFRKYVADPGPAP